MSHDELETDAIREIADAIESIPAGATVAIAGRERERRPLALLRELARQGRRPARLLARTPGPEGALLDLPLELVPLANQLMADFVLLHADAASVHGDVLLVDDPDNWYADRELAATGKVIVSVEQLVSQDTIVARPRDRLVPASRVEAVVHAPFGSHPLAFPGRYPADPMADLTGPPTEDHWAYLDAVGFARLNRRATNEAYSANEVKETER
ncbi:hypothetical protein ASE16_02675 [Leifsonia sp. Root227]|uniref:CoA transferase n=1 Tax=Leifsonia sp. Root227 TaxID=1736496 RepID=UPI0006F97C9D|nr:CoA transferase [Leifsonia sp. Root227]KRC51988.1 hypothetical protein ASE16_02675 [Leifsonia sp. Root227]